MSDWYRTTAVHHERILVETFRQIFFPESDPPCCTLTIVVESCNWYCLERMLEGFLTKQAILLQEAPADPLTLKTDALEDRAKTRLKETGRAC